MRVLALALIGIAAGSAFAQTTPDEMDLGTSFKLLRLEPEIMISITGVDQIDRRPTSLYSTAFFKWDPTGDTFSKAEINDYVNNRHDRRIVADGTVLWSYNFPQNTYSTFRYGAYSGGQPKDYRSNMLTELAASSQNPGTYLARVLRQTFGGEFAQYSPWFPGAKPTLVNKDGKTTQMADPVNPRRIYIADDLNEFVVFTYPARIVRSATFHLTRKDLSSPWTFTEMFYADRQPLGGTVWRTIDWTMTVFTGNLPSSTDYLFVPPTNPPARVIPNVKGQGAG